MKIINNSQCRSFPKLKEKILKVLEEYYNSNPLNSGKPFNKNTCSKHWWFDFLKKNDDIRELWKSLPLKKAPPVLNNMGLNTLIKDYLEQERKFMETYTSPEFRQNFQYGHIFTQGVSG